MKKNKRIKLRYIAAGVIIAASIAVTPACIDEAYQFRGYKAVGGEYLIIPAGLILTICILEMAQLWDELILKARKQEWENDKKKSEEKRPYAFRKGGAQEEN